MTALRCWQCHTTWTEAVLVRYQKCPFVDCAGTLDFPEPAPPKKIEKKKPVELPLFPTKDEEPKRSSWQGDPADIPF